MSRRTDVVARRVFGARTHGRALGSNVLSTSLAALLIHLTVGVAVVELRVCERLTSSSEEVPAILTLITCTFVLGQAHRIAGRMTLANAFEVMYRVG